MSGRFNILFMFCGLEIYISLIRICIYLNLKCCPLEKPLFKRVLFNIQSPSPSLMRPFFGTSGCWVRETQSVLLLSCKKPLRFFNEYLIYSSTSKDISENIISSFVYLCFKWICYKTCVIYFVGGKGGVDEMLGVFKTLYFRNYFFSNVHVLFFIYRLAINWSENTSRKLLPSSM